ncbi:unnamed protein product [Caenorhabditis sp. 36 PRJEB53466]|nr:unnamed protein product [Caenorhabditis sp. 36 PRJEB53466]
MSESEEEDNFYGLIPLAAKKERNTRCKKKVLVETNVHRLELSPNQPIYSYVVTVNLVTEQLNRARQERECSNYISKSGRRGAKYEKERALCWKFFLIALDSCDALHTGGPFFYDRQSRLYTFSEIKMENGNGKIELTLEGPTILDDRRFIRVEFCLEKSEENFLTTPADVGKTVNTCPGAVDSTLLEAMNTILNYPAIAKPNIVTIGDNIHYVIDPTDFNIPEKTFEEGYLYAGFGAKRNVMSLEDEPTDSEEKKPTVFMSTEMKITLFHPDWTSLIDLLQSYDDFASDLDARSDEAQRILARCMGLEVKLDFGPYEGKKPESDVIGRIRKFSKSARETFMPEHIAPNVTLEEFFNKQYKIILRYPRLFTIEMRGSKRNVVLPAEVLTSCPSQPVASDRMLKNEHEEMMESLALYPERHKALSEEVSGLVRMYPGPLFEFIEMSPPIKVEGIVLDAPKIEFDKNGSPEELRGPEHSFEHHDGHFYDPRSLRRWAVCYVDGEELSDLDYAITKEMRINGMNVADATITGFEGRRDLEHVFEWAESDDVELIVFVIKEHHDLHLRIKYLELDYNVKALEIEFETALKVLKDKDEMESRTRSEIARRVNLKLGGLNYFIRSDAFSNPNRLIIGFDVRQCEGANKYVPLTIGFAANMLGHFQQFAGGYTYVARDPFAVGANWSETYGLMITRTVAKILTKLFRKRGPPDDILVYLNGVTANEYGMINEHFSSCVRVGCTMTGLIPAPNITIIGASTNHNETLYKFDEQKGSVSNLEPGTVVDHTIVHPHYNEWYHSSAVARQGTVKTTKFTLIFTTNEAEPMSNIEELTNDLCYDHQIVFHPVELPAPLFFARRYCQRGVRVMSANGPIYENGHANIRITNERFGYLNSLFA